MEGEEKEEEVEEEELNAVPFFVKPEQRTFYFQSFVRRAAMKKSEQLFFVVEDMGSNSPCSCDEVRTYFVYVINLGTTRPPQPHVGCNNQQRTHTRTHPPTHQPRKNKTTRKRIQRKTAQIGQGP